MCTSKDDCYIWPDIYPQTNVVLCALVKKLMPKC